MCVREEYGSSLVEKRALLSGVLTFKLANNVPEKYNFITL
jgi:hypothetical protein